MSETIEELCTELEHLDQVDAVEGAKCRERVQEIFANPSIAVRIKTAIADLLMQANQTLVLKTVEGEDSY
jgi:DNA-directed RNA polymerase subunit F